MQKHVYIMLGENIAVTVAGRAEFSRKGGKIHLASRGHQFNGSVPQSSRRRDVAACVFRWVLKTDTLSCCKAVTCKSYVMLHVERRHARFQYVSIILCLRVGASLANVRRAFAPTTNLTLLRRCGLHIYTGMARDKKSVMLQCQ